MATKGGGGGRVREPAAQRVDPSCFFSWGRLALVGLHLAEAKALAGALCLFSPRARSGQVDVRLPILGQGVLSRRSRDDRCW